MAKKAVAANAQQGSVEEMESWMYYDKLNFIPVEEKDEVWAARSLMFIKTHSAPLVSAEIAADRRSRQYGKLDKAFHVARIDPEKKEAEYFHSDWEGNPIDQHLDDIIEATILQLPITISVKAQDELSISKKQENNRKILSRKLLRSIINRINESIGFPQLKETDDPHAYIQQMQGQLQQAQQSGPASQQTTVNNSQLPPDMIQSLLDQIDNNELLGIYNELLYKEGVEIATELIIDHYVNKKNKFLTNIAPEFMTDIKLFGKGVIRQYTSLTTGTPVLEYLRPEDVSISDFKKRDLSDAIHWFIEEEVNFGEFIRRCGAALTEDQLREVFELNRKNMGTYTGSYARPYDDMTPFERNTYMIKLGYAEWESQDMEVYADSITKEGNASFKQKPSDFVPGYRKNKKGKLEKDPNSIDSKRVEKHYNVWYKCYYIPTMFGNKEIADFDFQHQAQFIFQFGHLQDQERYGDDEEFSRSSLRGAYRPGRSWFEIKDHFKKEIDHLWLLVKNDLSQVTPHGLNWVYDLIVTQLKQGDDPNKSNQEAVQDWVAKLKQTGTAITKLMRDATGNIVPNVPAFTEIKTGYLEAAAAKIVEMMNIYQIMVKALGQNEFSEGEAAKPRTSFESIQSALTTSGKATFFIESMYINLIKGIGISMLKYISDVVQYGPDERLKYLEDIVGQVNMSAMMEIKDVPLRNLGLFIEPTMTKEQKDAVMALASSMASAGTLDMETALFLTFIDNLRQAYAILCFKKAQMDKQLAQAEQDKNNFLLQMEQVKAQNAERQIQIAGELKKELQAMMIRMETQMEQTVINLKGQWNVQSKEQIKNNRIEQDITASQIDRINNEDGAVPMRKDMPVAS